MSLNKERSNTKVTIITPVYNDWESLVKLLIDLDAKVNQLPLSVSVVAVNDGSNIPMPKYMLAERQFTALKSVELLDLACNMGHQRAIALGLADVASRVTCDAIIVMDADGEDKPEDIRILFNQSFHAPNHIIVARRAKRSEGLAFKVFYWIYKLCFRIITGKQISFGNFSFIPSPLLKRLIHMPDTWNNLAASILRSRIPVVAVATERGQRYAGQSKMNPISLMIHGLSAISIFADVAFMRLLLAALGLAAMTVIGMIIVVAIRILTDWAIPGWASYLIGILSVVFIQAIMLAAMGIFLLLNSRTSSPVLPINMVKQFVIERLQIFPPH